MSMWASVAGERAGPALAAVGFIILYGFAEAFRGGAEAEARHCA
jgi:hypothetical protein